MKEKKKKKKKKERKKERCEVPVSERTTGTVSSSENVRRG